jgi:hypothetical protein
MFLPVPEVLSGSVLKAKYTSMIARTQRVQDAQNIMRTIEAAAPFIQMDPSVADNFDGDESVMYIAKAYNFPQEALRTMKEKEGIRQARAEAQQQMVEAQQQAQQAETAAKASQAVAPLLQQGQAKAS